MSNCHRNSKFWIPSYTKQNYILFIDFLMVIFLEWKEIYWSLCMEWICPDTNSKKKVKISSSCDLETPIRPRVKSLNRQIWRLVKEAYMIRYDWIPRAQWISFLQYPLSNITGKWLNRSSSEKVNKMKKGIDLLLLRFLFVDSRSRVANESLDSVDSPHFIGFRLWGRVPVLPANPQTLNPVAAKRKVWKDQKKIFKEKYKFKKWFGSSLHKCKTRLHNAQFRVWMYIFVACLSPTDTLRAVIEIAMKQNSGNDNILI